jgi:hypothetical protein
MNRSRFAYQTMEVILSDPSSYFFLDFGFGMYAMTGSTAKLFLMDEGFKGWGGEDFNFHDR